MPTVKSKKLYEYQQKIVNELPTSTGLFLDTGCGKTATSLSLIAKLKPKNCLIITTKSLKENWVQEINMWCEGSGVSFMVISKEEFRKHFQTKLGAFYAIIVDEAHYFANYKSQLHKALYAYIQFHQPRQMYLLTATPIMSSVMSVWGLWRLIGGAPSFPSFQYRYFTQVKMGQRYIPMQKSGIEESVARDLRTFGYVMSKEEALPFLPEQIHRTETFDITDEQKKAIKNLDNDPTTTTPIVYYTKQLQILNGTLKVDDYWEVYKSEKLDRAIELAKTNKKLVIVARHNAELHMLYEHISKIKQTYIYNGATPEEERQKIIDTVNEDVSDRGTCLLLQAETGVGFNLQGVSLMVFYSHTWDYIKYYQCLGRTHRIGQKNVCVYIHMVVPGTIDEDVVKCLQRKESFDIALYDRK